MTTAAIPTQRRVGSWSFAHMVYIWFVMAGLLAQGLGSLVLDFNQSLREAMPYLLASLMNGNPPHAWLHIVWGFGGLVYLSLDRGLAGRLRLGLIFGTFYTLLGFLGIVVHDPFGMRLELPENAFHLTVGPLMLLLTYMAYRQRANA
jgi:hypothetical protein